MNENARLLLLLSLRGLLLKSALFFQMLWLINVSHTRSNGSKHPTFQHHVGLIWSCFSLHSKISSRSLSHLQKEIRYVSPSHFWPLSCLGTNDRFVRGFLLGTSVSIPLEEYEIYRERGCDLQGAKLFWGLSEEQRKTQQADGVTTEWVC